MKRSFTAMAEAPVDDFPSVILKHDKSFSTMVNETQSTPYPPRPYDLYREFVKVVIGKEQQSYTIYKGLACFICGYFRVALKQDAFKKDHENIVTLPNEEPEIFEEFIAWMNGPGALQPGDVTNDTIHIFIKLYAFADRRDVPLLENAIVDGVLQSFKNKRLVLNNTHLKWVCDQTREGTGLRRLMIRLMISAEPVSTMDQWKSSSDLLPSVEFLVDAARELAILAEGRVDHVCRFHTHRDVEKCDKPVLLNMHVAEYGKHNAPSNDQYYNPGFAQEIAVASARLSLMGGRQVARPPYRPDASMP